MYAETESAGILQSWVYQRVGGGDEELTGKEGLPEFIPENIFYRLAKKARNETAEKFQALIADKVIPSIRRTGTYRMIAAPLTPESAGGVARLITALRSTMKDNGQPPESISRMVKGLCDQLPIPMNETVVPVKNFLGGTL